MWAALVASTAAQVASAGVLFTNNILSVKGLGVGINYGTPPTFTTAYDKPGMRIDNAAVSRYAWLGWDLASTWALYGKSNFVASSFTYWGENGTGRDFNFAALAELGLDGWDQATLQYTNAPGAKAVNLDSEPDPSAGVNGNKPPKQQLDWTKIYHGTNLWMVNGGNPAVTANVANPPLGGNFDQSARYTTPNVVNAGLGSLTVNSNLTAWLKTDTDGLVTLIGVGGGNQNWWVGTNGQSADDLANGYVSSQPATLGELTRNSPTLTMVFDVRVALTGGGYYCPGDPGVDVSMFGTDVGVDYLLYTNGVYSKTVSGTGSSVSFGLQTAVGDYTAVASNTTTTATAPVPSTVTVFVPALPSFSVQPVGFVSATNGIAQYSVTAVGAGGGYQWHKGGVALTDDGHYSGTTTEQLTINPVLASDAATAANGYYCRIANLCGVVAYSTTNALTIQVGGNLVWQGTPTNTWNIATTANWTNSAGAAVVFNQGDNVTLDDTAINLGLVLSSPILAPGTVTFNHSALMGIGAGSGNGNISGSASKLIVNGPTSNSHLIISNANSYAGGTTINDGWLTLNNIGAVGSGTITLAGTGLSLLETVGTGGPNAGYPGLNVTENSIVQITGAGTYGGSFVGPITGSAGKTLTIQRPAGGTGDNIRIWNTNFTCDVDLVLNIGSANWAPYNDSGLQTYNGVISGSGVLFTRQGGRIILNGANTYFGGTRLSSGTTGVGIDSDGGLTFGPFGTGFITIEGNVGLFASGGDRTVGNSVVYTAGGGTLTFSDTNLLTMAGTFDLGSGGLAIAVNRTIGAATGSKGIISGVIGDASFPGCGLTKNGNGTLYLNAANTYTGPTTNTAGILAGTGSIPGSVVLTGGGIGGGSAAAIGTLSVGGNVSFNGGGAFIRVNRSGLQSDKVSVSGTLSASAAGTITVTNLGAALQAGDNFMLFPGKTVTGGSVLAVTGGGVTWTNKLEVDGSIQVLSTVSTTPPTLTNSVSGNTLTLSWPATHLGWSLQAQTNSLNVGIANNWVTIPGTAGVTSTNITVDPANPTVFYRLFYQAP